MFVGVEVGVKVGGGVLVEVGICVGVLVANGVIVANGVEVLAGVGGGPPKITSTERKPTYPPEAESDQDRQPGGTVKGMLTNPGSPAPGPV